MVYLMMSNDCVDGISQLDHAFFFSVQTAATIGADCSPVILFNACARIVL